MEGAVEADLAADLLDLLGRRAPSGDLPRRIGGHDEEEKVGDQADADQDEDRLDQPAGDIGEHQYRPFWVGSRMSRSASPTRLKPSARRMMAKPGKKTSHGAVVK